MRVPGRVQPSCHASGHCPLSGLRPGLRRPVVKSPGPCLGLKPAHCRWRPLLAIFSMFADPNLGLFLTGKAGRISLALTSVMASCSAGVQETLGEDSLSK